MGPHRHHPDAVRLTNADLAGSASMGGISKLSTGQRGLGLVILDKMGRVGCTARRMGEGVRVQASSAYFVAMATAYLGYWRLRTE